MATCPPSGGSRRRGSFQLRAPTIQETALPQWQSHWQHAGRDPRFASSKKIFSPMLAVLENVTLGLPPRAVPTLVSAKVRVCGWVWVRERVSVDQEAAE
eukprot:GHVU01186168.1.p1 GENE.GHVU01186168.1~~GHVU01186168.1.p1  ORF type:complete len:111 (-),score=8.05 GHVU01186168.1:605-901(-)